MGGVAMGDTEILKQALRGGKVKPIVKRADSRHWNKTKENRFLDCLAATCNVAASLREVGMSDTTVYRHRNSYYFHRPVNVAS